MTRELIDMPHGWSRSVHPAAWALARRTLYARETLVLLAATMATAVIARVSLPFGLASSQTRVEATSTELRGLLLVGLTLLVLLRAIRWGALLNGLASPEKALIIVTSIVYVHVIGSAFADAAGWTLFRAPIGFDWVPIEQSVWLASLASILAFSRASPRTLGLCFLLLAWWVPVLGFPDPSSADAVSKGISHPPWSADGILPMLVPHLLAVGYVCLERAQR